jgi:hypothetical protein
LHYFFEYRRVILALHNRLSPWLLDAFKVFLGPVVA